MFAGVALLLALAGVYGVMAYTVSQRVPELGVRIALGATPENIRALIFGQGAKLAGAGLALGIVLALLGGRLLEGLLFGVTASDPLILVAVDRRDRHGDAGRVLHPGAPRRQGRPDGRAARRVSRSPSLAMR